MVYLTRRYTPSLNKIIFSKNNSGNFQAVFWIFQLFELWFTLAWTCFFWLSTEHMLGADASFLTFIPLNCFSECGTYIYNLIRECNPLYNLTKIFPSSSASTHILSTTLHYSFWLLPWRAKKWMKKDKSPYFFNHQFVLFVQKATISSNCFPFNLIIAHSIFPYYILCITFQWNSFV